MPRLAASAARIALLPPEVLIERACHPRRWDPHRPPGRQPGPTGPQSCVMSRNALVASGNAAVMPGNASVSSPSHAETTVRPMADLFQDYPFGRAWDEMFSGPGVIRPAYESVHAALQTLSAADLKARADIMGRTFLDQGITFALGGGERPFPLGLIPRIVPAQEWKGGQTGVPQGVKALEAFLADCYGRGRIFDDGVVPRRLVTTSPHFHRQVAGMDGQDGARIVISGVDLIRDEHGAFRVLEDNVRVPSGVSYVLENRQAVSQVLSEAGGDQQIRSVAEYPGRLLAALRAVSPANVNDPTVVVLTPGVYNSAYFEHTLLAREMGVELVEGRDLICRNNRVFLHTTSSEMPVNVIYRRVDDEFLDPMQFRADSLLGSPGLINAARAGNLTIANAVGNGIADDKLVYTYVPDIIRYYLNEEPILLNVDTYRMEVPDHREYALEHLAELVLKPVDGSGGKGIVIGSRADSLTLAKARATILDNPRGWIAQREIALSTVPTLIGDKMRPRHVDLRPFAVNNGNSVWVLPGGLTRVALPEGELVVNSSQGGGSKDTWVLGGLAEVAPEPAADATQVMKAIGPNDLVFDSPLSPMEGTEGFRLQQGQQQQGGAQAAENNSPEHSQTQSSTSTRE